MQGFWQRAVGLDAPARAGHNLKFEQPACSRHSCATGSTVPKRQTSDHGPDALATWCPASGSERP